MCDNMKRTYCDELCKRDTDETECNRCFRQVKFCELAAIECHAKYDYTTKREVLVPSKTPLGIETVPVRNPQSNKWQLWVTFVENGSPAANAGVAPGFVLESISEADTKKMARRKAKGKEDKDIFKELLKVSDLEDDSEIGDRITREINEKLELVYTDSTPQSDDWKLSITFSKPSAQWSLKEKKFFQLGWLDRICYKVNPKSKATIALTSDEGIMTSDKSDHMPVKFGATVTRG